MSDLISRQAAIEAICYNCMIKETCNGICDDTDRLRKLPAIDADIANITQMALEAGEQGEEIKFYIGGRKFAIMELAQ